MAKRTDYSLEVPAGEAPDVWAGACALAIRRHPNAIYPQPHDVEDARIVAGAFGATQAPIPQDAVAGSLPRHQYEPHRKYPWFCRQCGYPEHETLKHLPRASGAEPMS